MKRKDTQTITNLSIKVPNKQSPSCDSHRGETVVKNEKRKSYQSPAIEVMLIEMEQGVASGSSVEVPVDHPTDVQHQWDDQVEDVRTFEW